MKHLRQGTASDKRAAKSIQKALGAARSVHLKDQFVELADFIKSTKLKTLDRAKDAVMRSRNATDELKKVLAVLTHSQSLAYFVDTRKELAKLIARVAQVIQVQASVRAETVKAKVGAPEIKKLHKAQKKCRNLAHAIARSLTNRNAPDCATEILTQLKKAVNCQMTTEGKLLNGEPGKAVADQDGALRYLQQVKQDLQDHDQLILGLAQEQVLLGLQKRCQKILDRQLDVHAGSAVIRESIERNNGKIANLHKQDALKLSDLQKELGVDVAGAIELLKLQEVPFDFLMDLKLAQHVMKLVVQRLENAQVDGDEGKTTLLATLKIIHILGKVQGDIKNVRANLDAKTGGKLRAALERPYSKLTAALQNLCEAQELQTQSLITIFKSQVHGGPLKLLECEE